MTRAQYVALCLIGGIAVMAWVQSYQIAKALQHSGALGGTAPVVI